MDKEVDRMKIWIKSLSAGLSAAAFALLFTSIVLANETKNTDQTTKQDVKRKTMEAIQAIKSYSSEQRNRAVKEAKQVTEDLDARIERMQSVIQKKWNHMDQTTQERANDTLKALRAKRNELSEWYGGLKHSSAGAWDQVKKGFVDGYESLATGFDKAEKEFESDTAGKN